jgi:hypothetical protein
VNNEEAPDVQDATALYYALSIIAQCAAALAALIGFLGMWRLDRLKHEREQAGRNLPRLMVSKRGISDFAVDTYHIDFVIQQAEQLIATPKTMRGC